MCAEQSLLITIQISGRVTEVALEAFLHVPPRKESMHLMKNSTERAKDHFVRDEKYINGVGGRRDRLE